MIIPTKDEMSDSRSSGSKLLVLVAFGMIIALLLLNVAVVAVDDVTDLNVSNVTPSPENTELPITLAADLVTPDATIVPTESLIIADETPADTPVTPTLFSGSSQFIDGPAEIVSTTGLSGISNPSTADIQYTVHTAKRVTQAQREAAAANYKEFLKKQYLTLNPIIPRWGQGFSVFESDPDNNWRWASSSGTVFFDNPTPENRVILINTTIRTGWSENANVTIQSSEFSDTLAVNNLGTLYERKIIVPPGSYSVTFHCDAARVPVSDPRNLVFRMDNFKTLEIM